jgi:D-alanyl-D-alanine carboxypeptidase
VNRAAGTGRVLVLLRGCALMAVTGFALIAVTGCAPARATGPAPADAQARTVPVTEVELIRQANALVDSLAAADAFAGVVLIARDGAPVLERAVGYADRESARPNSIGTAFNIGSINKAFTQIGVMQLAAAGRLDLDAPLASAWADYPNADVARRVTIRQLLRHQAGIGGNIFAAPAGGTRAGIRHNRDFLQLFVDAPLQFEPGARQQYSNAGYVVLGMLVERISGEDYYEYVRRHVYEPAGMVGTVHFAADSLPPHAAVGYARSGEAASWTRNSPQLPGRGSAAGGGYSTAHDLMRFVQALRERRIPSGLPPGLGIAGGAPGLNAVVEGDLPGGYDLVVLANMSPPAAEYVARRIRGILGARD